MEKMKKIVVSAIIGVMALVGFYTTANAYSVGEKINVTFNEYKTNSNIYCVEHNQKLKASNEYEIISQVRIEGNKSIDYAGNEQTNLNNAKLAYILSADNGDEKGTGPVSNAIWNNMYTWMNEVGQHHAGLYVGFASNTSGSRTLLEDDANDYANNLNDANQTNIIDYTNRSNIKVVDYEKDGISYIRVGPFNWSFSGTMKNAVVEDQNGQAISSVLYSSFNGNDEYWYGAEKLQSGKDFYVSIPISADVSKITRITGYTQTMVKGVNIWFLKATKDYKQNLIIREPYEAPLDIETPFDYNIETPVRGDLKVIKINKDNKEIKLPGVGFYIQRQNTGKYVKQEADGKISYVDGRENATEFVTDEKGEILVKDLIIGTYVAYETKNPNYGYEILKEGQLVEVLVNKTTEFTIGNKQIYVKLSGYVWVDKVDGKKSERNDLYRSNTSSEIVDDGNDILFNGITVRLKDRTTGETVKETVTSKLDRYDDSVNDGNGEYLFIDVLKEKLGDYYIEFEYDGLTYTNVIPHIEKDRGSKAAESEEERDTFNKNFSKVEGKTKTTGFTRDANGNEKHDLSYTINERGNEARLINNGQYKITSNTDVTRYSIKDQFTEGDEEIRYINLGLYEREQPDIKLWKDLQNVRVAVNGFEHTYLYSKRFENAGQYEDGFNVGVKFGEESGRIPYSRAIYKSDFDYINENDKSKELKVYVTYQLMIENQSATDLTAQINSIADYYDSRYEIVSIGTKLDEKGNTNEDIAHLEQGKLVGNATQTNYNESYKKVIFNTNTRVEGQTKENIAYVQFILNREAVINVLNDKENLHNTAEINSYSIYNNNKIYAGIDIDSNPGNYTPEDGDVHEDDTDRAPGLKLEVADNGRQLSGKVFLDETSRELKVGEVRQGSGAYEEGEKGIEGVDITLTENTESGKVYTAKTNADGDFFIEGYIPGDYTLTYTWGDQTYTVQNYKGTIYDTTRDRNDKNWYKQNEEKRLTDALDDYNMRLDIDEELKDIKYSTTTTKEKMNSNTPTMGIGVEIADDGNTRYGITSIDTEMDGDRFVPKDFVIKNVDFGIVERARQQLELVKRVKTLKATLANGQVIANIEIDENGNVTGDQTNITYMKPDPNTNPANGFVKLELDNELLQGTTLEVGYEIKAINQSELDYLSQNFYQYGIIEGEVITIEPTAIIDYLDKDWGFDENKNPQWQLKTVDELKDLVAEVVYNDEESTIEEKRILYTEDLKGHYLKPTETATTMLNVSKVLTTTDEISLNNETELIELTKKGGSKPEPKPGNYVPGKGSLEIDDSMAETTIVTPATGENQNYVMPIIIGATALITLGAGVIFIKKKVI